MNFEKLSTLGTHKKKWGGSIMSNKQKIQKDATSKYRVVIPEALTK